MRVIKKKEILNRDVKVNFFVLLFNSFFFIGFIPVASGSFASAFSLLPFLISYFNNIFVLFIAIVLFFIISLLTGKDLLKKYGDDPSVLVIDEVIGMWLTILVIKLFFNEIYWLHFVVGFFLFRFFDIVKIYPAIYFDKLNNTFGVLMDDVISGVYAGLFSSLIIYVINIIK